MATGWVKLQDVWYYLESNGAMITGTQNIDGKQYIFDNLGKLISNASTSTSELPLEKTGVVINVQTHLNVRQGPGKEYNSIGQLYEGNTVSIVSEIGSWYKIRYDSTYGYIYSKYIKFDSDTLDEQVFTELIVVSGSEHTAALQDIPGYGHFFNDARFKYNFIEPAIKQLQEFKYNHPKSKITWLISIVGYSDKDIKNFIETAKALNVNIEFFSSAKTFIDYINNGSTDCNRSFLKISNITVFSHGLIEELALSYDQDSKSFSITKKEIDCIENNICTSSMISHFYACNIGTKPSNGDLSFAEAWHNKFGGKTIAAIKRTEYSYINGDWNSVKDTMTELRKNTGYRQDGSLYYPILGKDAQWITLSYPISHK